MYDQADSTLKNFFLGFMANYAHYFGEGPQFFLDEDPATITQTYGVILSG